MAVQEVHVAFCDHNVSSISWMLFAGPEEDVAGRRFVPYRTTSWLQIALFGDVGAVLVS